MHEFSKSLNHKGLPRFAKHLIQFAKRPVLRDVFFEAQTAKTRIACVVLALVTGAAFAEYSSCSAAMEAGEELLWKQEKPIEAQAVFEQAFELGQTKNDKGKAAVRIAVCRIKQNKPEEGIEVLKTVLEDDSYARHILCDAAVALGDVYSYRKKEFDTAKGYYKQGLSLCTLEKRRQEIQKKIDRISKKDNK